MYRKWKRSRVSGPLWVVSTCPYAADPPSFWGRGSFSQRALDSINSTLFFFFISHPLIKIQVSHCLKPHMLTPSPWPFDPTSFSILFSSSTSIRSPQPPSSSFPRPGLRAPSACVLAAREGPDIWPRSGPGRPTHPWSALPPYNVAVRTSCGRH